MKFVNAAFGTYVGKLPAEKCKVNLTTDDVLTNSVDITRIRVLPPQPDRVVVTDFVTTTFLF